MRTFFVFCLLFLSASLSAKDWTKDVLLERLEKHVSSDQREKLREELWKDKDFPKKLLVELLSHENPAIRNESIELLEEVAGGDFGYIPLNDPESDKTKDSIDQWLVWVGSDQKIEKKASELADEDAYRYFSDIMTGDREGFYRSVRRLSPFGLDAVGKIQGFIDATPQLTEGGKARLKQAQYQLLLTRSNIGSPEVVARELTFGSRDQKLKALNALKSAGLVAVPVIKDFIESSDALVRETSVDAMLEVGGDQVLDLVQPILEKETDPNVIHIALRKLKNVGGPEAKEMVGTFLTHENEDIVMSALKIYKSFDGNSYRSWRSSGEAKLSDADKLVLQLLEDKRWRVLSAALEYVAKQQLRGAEDKVVELMRFDDEFVVANAVKAAVALKSQKALPVLEELLKKQDSNVQVLVEGIVNVSGTVSQQQIKLITARGPDAIEALIAANAGSYKYNATTTNIVANFVKHDNIDVACAALRSLASSRSRVEQDYVANILSDAIRSGEKEKISAVLSNLELPANPVQPRVLGGVVRTYAAEGVNEELNQLFKAFHELSEHVQKAEPVVESDSSGGIAGLIESLKELNQKLEDPEEGKRVKLLLIDYGDVDTLEVLAAKISDLEPSEKIAIVKSLRDTRSAAGLKALKALLNDPSSEVRGLAAYAFFYEEDNYGLVKEGLEASIQEGSLLTASELYSSQLNYAARERKNNTAFKNWSKDVLESDTVSAGKKVIALSLLRSRLTSDLVPTVQKLTTSENQFLRRAAWHLLAYEGKIKLEQEQVQGLLEDKSLLVRMALPMALNKKISQSWVNYFNDRDTSVDYFYDYNSRIKPLKNSVVPILRELAAKDTSEQVRYEALFTLLCYGNSIDIDVFIALLLKQPENSKAQERLLSFVGEYYKTMGKGMGTLVSSLDLRKLNGRKRAEIINYFFGSKAKLVFGSFEELSKAVKIIEAEPQHVEASQGVVKVAREEVKLFYFYEKGCKECARVEKDVLPKLEEIWAESSDVKLEITWYDIYDPASGEVNRAMAQKIGSPRVGGKKPAIFSEVEALLERDITLENVLDMAHTVAELPVPEVEFEEITEEERALAKQTIEEEYNALTLPIIIIAGLLDGINPCAFATIIFFLSYLQVAKRSTKEIFFVGVAFILGVFLAYFSIGLVFHSILAEITGRFSGVKTVLNYVFAAVALVVAYFSFKDYLKARKGDLKGMSLQLPGMLKDKVKTVVRKGSTSSLFVLAAFVTGVVISFIELACTGQVYIPIIYQVQQGNHDAVFYLLCFNIAFVLPLVIIFGLAMMGMKSSALIDFQKKHTAKIKILFTILFLLLALMLLFNEQVSGWFIHLKNWLGIDRLGS